MKAMIFAAGLGTRLKPITENKPKALVTVNGIPMLELLIRKLTGIGITNMIINVHHFAGQVIEFLDRNDRFGIDITVSDESDLLLDTGGGLKKAAWFFDDAEDFLVHNVDVISNIDLTKMIAFHKKSNNLSTLAVRSRKSGKYLLFDENNILCGWRNVKTGEKIQVKETDKIQELAFSGIHVMNPRLLSCMADDGKFSIINTYLRLAESESIMGYRHDSSYWFDIGRPDQLAEAAKILQDKT